jgi:hypothetical protein
VKVIGAGFGRTGTASLQSALQELGFGPCYHMYEVFEHPEHADFWEAAWRGEAVDWDEVLGSYEATVAVADTQDMSQYRVTIQGSAVVIYS